MLLKKTDEQLVKSANQGSDRAWRQLVDRYEKRLYNHALRMVGNPEDANDLLQDVLLAVYRNLSGFRGDAPFGAWVFRIATFRCTDHLRRKRPVALPVDELVDPVTGSNPAIGYENARTNQDIIRLLAKLSADQRQVIELKFFQNFTFEEIGSQLGISANTAKTRLYSALRKLRKTEPTAGQHRQGDHQ